MITMHPFGTLSDGTPVTRCRLTAPDMYVDVIDYGAAITSIVVPDLYDTPTNIVLGYDTAADYESDSCCLGATVGRHANRIGGARFTLNGQLYPLEANDGPNHLHGGFSGWHHRMFTAEADGDTLRLTLHSPDGDQGYPGNLTLTVAYTLKEQDLTVRFTAVSDRDTVLNVTNHSYFDLSGGQNPMGQRLFLASEQFCENDEHTLPTGALRYVLHTPFDFRQEKPVGRDLTAEDDQLRLCGGYDHNFVLDNGGSLAPCATLRSPETGIRMMLWTDLPGVQLYSGNALSGPWRPRQAICLEPQFFPNALNIPGWKPPILRAGETFDHTILYQFG